MRSGHFVSQPAGYRAFIPAPLPPAPPIAMDEEMTRLLEVANLAVGRLDGIATTVPSVDMFVAMYVRQEAVLSSQIEGTQSTLDDVLVSETDEKGIAVPRDVGEVVNYVRAMNHGLERLPTLPLSLRLIREIHGKLMKGARGGLKDPGEFRRSQNWIGGRMPSEALFVPPPPEQMHEALGNLEKFLHDRESLPTLVHCAVAHAQFETIHPFLDGNGRTGRLLIALLLCERGLLHHPLLYISLYLKANRAAYYAHLTDIRRKGDWEGWIKFFLRGVETSGNEAVLTARKVFRLREANLTSFSGDVQATKLLHALCAKPLVSAGTAASWLDCSVDTAARVIQRLEAAGILVEITGRQRNRLWRYEPYVRLFSPGTDENRA